MALLNNVTASVCLLFMLSQPGWTENGTQETGLKSDNSEVVCIDRIGTCLDYVSRNASDCVDTPSIFENCKKTCQLCEMVDKKFDVKNLPEVLHPLAYLLGIWRAESGGKAVYPTMPVFTYGEQMEISLPSQVNNGLNALNYSSHAWDMNEQQPLHSEYGYITIKNNTKTVALTTVMDNGFVTVEEGPLEERTIIFKLVDIGRISFSRDLPVHGTRREWRLLSSDTLENRFFMETLTHRMQLHTSIVYKKIYPN